MKTFSLYRRAHGRSLKALEQAYEHHNLNIHRVDSRGLKRTGSNLEAVATQVVRS